MTAVRTSLQIPRLSVIMGPMWSGKTNALLLRVEESRPAFTSVVAIKHSVDQRHPGLLSARTGLQLPATFETRDLHSVGSPSPHTLYGIDEAQVRRRVNPTGAWLFHV